MRELRVLIASFTECTTELEGPDFLNATNGVRGKSPSALWGETDIQTHWNRLTYQST